MTNAPISRQQQMLDNVAREEAGDRRTIMRVQIAAALVLVASTLLAWENHPRVAYHGGFTPGYSVREVSHSIGLATRPAGLLCLALAVLALASAPRLRRARLSSGLAALAPALAALGVTSVEIVQLMFGRRDWLDHVTHAVTSATLGQAVGIGVWLAGAASVALVANASTYVWLEYRLWRKNPTAAG